MNYIKRKVVPRLPVLDIYLRKISPCIAFQYNKIRHNFISFIVKNDIKEIEVPKIFPLSTINKEIINLPIFILWWQGEEHMSPIIRACVNSIKRASGNHEVILISKNNINTFISLGHKLEFKEEVLQWIDEKTISPQYFSDILRAWLLYNYGGVWMDATIFVPDGNIDDFILDQKLYTRKIILYNALDNYFVSRSRWSSYFWATIPYNPIFKYLYESLIQVVVKNNGVYEYFTIDYILNILYNNSSSFKEHVDSLPAVDKPQLLNNLNLPFTSVEDLKNDYKSFYKLTHKYDFEEFTSEGKSTWYKYIIDNYN